MYSKNTLALNRVTLSKAKNRTQIFTIVNLATLANSNQTTLLASMLQNATRKQKQLFQKLWRSKGLITSIKHKQRLYRTHFLKGNFSERQFYKRYANKLTRLKNLSKIIYYKEALNEKSNSKELWKLINSVILNKRANNPIYKKLTVYNIEFEEPEAFSEQLKKFL